MRCRIASTPFPRAHPRLLSRRVALSSTSSPLTKESRNRAPRPVPFRGLGDSGQRTSSHCSLPHDDREPVRSRFDSPRLRAQSARQAGASLWVPIIVQGSILRPGFEIGVDSLSVFGQVFEAHPGTGTRSLPDSGRGCSRKVQFPPPSEDSSGLPHPERKLPDIGVTRPIFFRL
jgi:hypothetical protein